jgi:hypothetical protein
MPKRSSDQPPLTFSLIKPSKVVPGPRIEKMSQTKGIRRAMRSLDNKNSWARQAGLSAATKSGPLPKAPPAYYVGKLADAERAWRDRYPGDVAGKED